nr:hypothetical protein [Tanacetum cinerariifolium]
HPTNQVLYHALMEALIADEEAMYKGVADSLKQQKRPHGDDDKDPSAGPNQGKKTKRKRTKESKSSKKASTTKENSRGKAPTKGSKAGKSVTIKELVEEPITEMVMNDAVNTAAEDVVHDDDQLQDASEPKTENTPKHNWSHHRHGLILPILNGTQSK